MTFIKMASRALSMVLLLQTAFANPVSETLSEEQCGKLHEMNGNYFLLEENKTVTGIPADMHVDWKSGNVYYTLVNVNNGEGELGVYVLDKQTGLERKVNVADGQSTAVDNTNHVVYFATDNGVYKQKDDGSTELYAASGQDVMYVTVTKDGSVMYVATYPNNTVYKITQDGKTEEEFPAVPSGRGLTVDPLGNLFFADEKSAYVLKAGQTVPDKVEGLPSDKSFDFYVNKDDEEVFAMDEDSRLYHVEGFSATATYWGSFGVEDANTFAMDDVSNVYVGAPGALKKFKHFDENPCVKV